MIPLPIAPRSFARRAALGLAALFLAAFALYLHSLSPAYHPDDSPETITAGAILGIQHPPGYPLHSLLGRQAVLLGPGPATFDVSLVAALCGALAVVLAACALFVLGREFDPWSADQGSLGALALGGAAAIGATQTLWFQATIPKGGIYTLNMALSLGTLLCLMRVREAGLTGPVERPTAGLGSAPLPDRGAVPAQGALAMGGLLFGLGMANHWTSQVVLLPGYALLLAEAGLRGRAWPSWRALGRMTMLPAALFLCGLGLYAYVVLRSRLGAALVWGDPSDWKGFWWIFDRSQYAGLESGKSLANFLVLLRRIAEDAASDWTWPGLACCALGWAVMARRAPFLALAAACLPLGLAVAVAWKANPPADALFIIDPYLVPVHVGLGLGLAGWAALPRLRTWTGPLFAAGALALAAHQWALCDHHDDYLAWDYTNNLLLGAPRGALLFCEGDSNTACPLVPRLVQGRRRDLTPIASVLIDYPWYRAALLRMDPGLKLPPFYRGPAQDLDWISRANAPRPTLWTNSYNKDWVDERHLLVRGLSELRTDAARPHSRAVLDATRVLPAFALRGAFEPGRRAMDPITVRLVRDNYVDALAELAEAYNALNAFDPAMELDRRLGVLRPGWAPPWLLSGSMAWYKGDVALAGVLWQRAADEDPTSAEAWSDLGLVALEQGRPVQAQELARKSLALNPALSNAQALLQAAQQAPQAGAAPRQGSGGAQAATEGDVLAKAGKMAQAVAAYDRAISLGFANVALYRNRGMMLGQMGKVDEAVASLRKAASLDPGNPELYKLMGYFEFNAGRRKEGVAMLERGLALAPKDADLLRLVADAKKKAGIP